MKFLLKRKFVVIPLIVTIVALAIAGVVLATNQIIISGQANVVSATYDIEVYSDPACTVQLPQPLTWSVLPTGEKRSKTVYLKNTGNSDASVTRHPFFGCRSYFGTRNGYGTARREFIVISAINRILIAPIGSAPLTITLISVQASQVTTTTTPAP